MSKFERPAKPHQAELLTREPFDGKEYKAVTDRPDILVMIQDDPGEAAHYIGNTYVGMTHDMAKGIVGYFISQQKQEKYDREVRRTPEFWDIIYANYSGYSEAQAV